MSAASRKKQLDIPATPPTPTAQSIPSNRDRLPFTLSVVVAVFSMLVYVLTLSPGVSWGHHSEDSGDLITAAWVAGIPHPTGYPLFTMLGWLWSHIIPFGSVAWRMNAFSAFWGAMAAGIMVRAVWRSFSLIPDDTLTRIGRSGRAIAATSAGFLLAFATYVWQQSVVTEVYSLNLFFTSLVSWILIELLAGANDAGDPNTVENAESWTRRRGKLVMLLGLSWGLAMTNHMLSIFLFPSILMVLLFGNLKLRLGEFLKGAGCWALALFCYLYMPIRSAMNPPLDYGDAQTWRGFVWMVTGQQFRRIMFTLIPYMSLHQIMKYNSIPVQLGIPGTIAAFAGVIRFTQARSRPVVILAIHSLLMIAYALYVLSSYSIWDPEGYVLGMIWGAVLWASWSIVFLSGAPGRLGRAGRAFGIFLLLIAPIASLVGHWKECDLSANRDAMQFGEESFASFEPNAIVMDVRYERGFVLWYYREVEYVNTRGDVKVIYLEHTVFQWGLDLLKRKYPDILVPDTPLPGPKPELKTAAWITRHNIANHPIYIGSGIGELQEEGYRFQAVGLMFRVYPPGE
jgi:hypothetical protein